MYKLESYNNGGARVVNSDDSDEIYRSTFNASSAQEAESIVVGLNQGVLLKILADHRYAIEIGGIELPNGLRMLTDRDNRSTFKESYQDMRDGLIPDTDWKAVNSCVGRRCSTPPAWWCTPIWGARCLPKKRAIQ